MSLYCSATARAVDRNKPSENFMMLLLWTAVTFLRPFLRAYSNAARTMRSVPNTEMGLMLMPESGRILTPESSLMCSISLRAFSLPFSNSMPA